MVRHRSLGAWWLLAGIALGCGVGQSDREDDAALETTGWRAHLPRGRFQRFANLEMRATRQFLPGRQSPLEMFGPALDGAEEIVERIRCSVSGDNPGPVAVQCARDESGYTNQALVDRDGTFHVRFPGPEFDPTQDGKDLFITVTGHLDRRGSLTIESYQYVRIVRCHTSGPCRPAVDWTVLNNIRGIGVATAPLTERAECTGPANRRDELLTEPKLGVVGDCPICYRAIDTCNCDSPPGCSGKQVCVHEGIGPDDVELVDREQSCGRFDKVATFYCLSRRYNVCINHSGAGESDGSNGRPVLSTPDQCPTGYHDGPPCSGRHICVRDGADVRFSGGVCPPGYADGPDFTCPFTGTLHSCFAD